MGGCLLPDGAGCIHSVPSLRLPFSARIRLLGNRRFWRRVLYGTR
jgi:hypothetical protein